MSIEKLILVVDYRTYRKILNYCKKHGFNIDDFMTIALAKLLWKYGNKNVNRF